MITFVWLCGLVYFCAKQGWKGFAFYLIGTFVVLLVIGQVQHSFRF